MTCITEYFSNSKRAKFIFEIKYEGECDILQKINFGSKYYFMRTNIIINGIELAKIIKELDLWPFKKSNLFRFDRDDFRKILEKYVFVIEESDSDKETDELYRRYEKRYLNDDRFDPEIPTFREFVKSNKW